MSTYVFRHFSPISAHYRGVLKLLIFFADRICMSS